MCVVCVMCVVWMCVCVQLNHVSVGVKCRGINTEGREVFCDFGCLMMNDHDTGKLILRTISCEQ